jgi:death-on-curing protein
VKEGQWAWVALDVIHAIHDRQLSEHGGGVGVRDAGAIESALARPQNLVAYGSPDAAELAAAYAFGIAKNHRFVDGDKRTAWVASRLFLAINGISLKFDPAEAVRMVEALAAGMLPEPDVAAWFRVRII